MAWAILDVDGVLADVRHRLRHVQKRPKDWDAFFAGASEDAVLTAGLERAEELAADHDVIYLTGRPERLRAATQHWLRVNGFPEADLLMRPDHDRRPARLFKVEEVRRLSRRQAVALVVDDDDAVIEALRDAGFTVQHAAWMSGTETQQTSLFDAQEQDGRT